MFPFGLPFVPRRTPDLSAALRDLGLRVDEIVDDDEFDVQLTSYDSSTGHYAWTEQTYDASGAFYAHPGGRSGTTSMHPAKTFNGEVIGNLPKYGRIRKRLWAGNYGVIYEILTGAAVTPPHVQTFWQPGLAISVPINTGWVALGSGQLTSTGLYQIFGVVAGSVGTSTASSQTASLTFRFRGSGTGTGTLYPSSGAIVNVCPTLNSTTSGQSNSGAVTVMCMVDVTSASVADPYVLNMEGLSTGSSSGPTGGAISAYPNTELAMCTLRTGTYP